MAFLSFFTVLECSSFLQQSRRSVVCVSCTHVCSHGRWNGWSHLTSGSTHSIKTRSKTSLFWRNAEHGAGGKSWFASSHTVFEKVISYRPLNKKAEDVPVHYYMAVSHKDWELPNHRHDYAPSLQVTHLFVPASNSALYSRFPLGQVIAWAWYYNRCDFDQW